MPKVNPVSEPYWSGLRQGVLNIQKCAVCGTLRHYPRLLCGQCWTRDVLWVQACGRATLHTWSVARHAFHPGFADETPYVMAVADLEEGVRALGRMRAVAPESLRIGMPLRFAVFTRPDGLAVPGFDPV